ncbi:MAG: hypothetical protein ACI33K_11500 [Clostridiaceae bacterium]
MGIGYTLGCLLSILLWSLKRSTVFNKIEYLGHKFHKGKILVYLLYLIMMITGVWFFLTYKNEWTSFIIAFMVVDISNSEKSNINASELKFHKTIALNCKALVCGFVAPLFYILIFGNYMGFIYTLVFHISEQGNYRMLTYLLNILSIIPAFISQVILYGIALVIGCKDIDFKGDYIENSFKRPFLNLEVIAASIESVSFYYYFQEGKDGFIKAYGKEKNRLSFKNIIHYTGILYTASFVSYIVFIIICLRK